MLENQNILSTVYMVQVYLVFSMTYFELNFFDQLNLNNLWWWNMKKKIEKILKQNTF